MMDKDTLHIYAQPFWHEGAWIVGTLDSLKALRDAIDAAMQTDQATCELFASDGEGYDVTVAMLAADADRAWAALQMPYTDAMDIATWKGQHPADMFKPGSGEDGL